MANKTTMQLIDEIKAEFDTIQRSFNVIREKIQLLEESVAIKTTDGQKPRGTQFDYNTLKDEEGTGFSWENFRNMRYEVIQNGVEPEMRVSLSKLREFVEMTTSEINPLTERKNDLPPNGYPVNKVLRMFCAYGMNPTAVKYASITTILMEKAGFTFGEVPEGEKDTKKVWYQKAEKLRNAYRERVMLL